MKVSELTGALLDYWAGRAEGHKHISLHETAQGVEYCALHGNPGCYYTPSTNWAQGGPILAKLMATRNWNIEQWDSEHVSPDDRVIVTNYADNGDAYDSYDEAIGGHSMPRMDFTAQDVLTAVCQAFVAHHYGAEVPDEVPS